jgi:hypothetical protein
MLPPVNIIHDYADVERYVSLMKELDRCGIRDATLWNAIMETPAHVGIIRSHKKIVKWAKENKVKEVVIAENDFYFPSKRGYEYFLHWKPQYFDIYLAGIYVGRDKLKENRKVTRFSGLHFYIIRQQFYETFLQIDEAYSLDNQLSVLAQMNLATIYCLYPMACIQHENMSSTSGCVFEHRYYFDKENVYGL